MSSASNCLALIVLTGAAAGLGACESHSDPMRSPFPDGSVLDGAAPFPPAIDAAQSDAVAADAQVPTPSGDAGVSDASTSDASAVDAALSDAAARDAGRWDGGTYTCSPPASCMPVDTSFVKQAACCAPNTPCGLVIPELNEENQAFFPDAKGFLAELTKDDPNGKCAPESFYFGTRPGLDKQRIEPGGTPDIFITPECESFTLLAFILPGCCMPNNKCAYSTHESYNTLEYLVTGGVPLGTSTAPFTKQICVSAADLNQQLRDSKTLKTFARVTGSEAGCDYQALVKELPETFTD